MHPTTRHRPSLLAALTLLVALALALASPARGAGWQALIDPGETAQDKSLRIVQTADGGFAVLAEHDGTTFRLTRLSAKGKVQPTTGLPGTIDDMHGSTFVALADGGFAGGSFGPRFVRYDRTLARTVKRFEAFAPKEDGDFVLSFLAAQPDGGFIGLAQSQKALVRLTIDKSGALGPLQKVSGSFNRLSSLGGTALLKDGGLVVTGDTDAASDDQRDVRVVKLDAQGKVAYDASFGGPKKDYGAVVTGTSDGGVLVGGGTVSTGAGALDWYLVRLDAAGKKVWEKTYGSPSNDFLVRVVELPGGGFLAGGNFGDQPTLMKLGADGSIIWQRSYRRGYLADFVALPDGGVAALALIKPDGFKRVLTLVLRTDAKGDAGKEPKLPKAPPAGAGTPLKKASPHAPHGSMPHGALPRGALPAATPPPTPDKAPPGPVP